MGGYKKSYQTACAAGIRGVYFGVLCTRSNAILQFLSYVACFACTFMILMVNGNFDENLMKFIDIEGKHGLDGLENLKFLLERVKLSPGFFDGDDSFARLVKARKSNTFPKWSDQVSQFNELKICAKNDVRCQYELAVFYFLGRPPLLDRDLPTSVKLLWLAARGGSGNAQFLLGIFYQNFYLLSSEPPFRGIDDGHLPEVVVDANFQVSFVLRNSRSEGNDSVNVISEDDPWGGTPRLSYFWKQLCRRFEKWHFPRNVLKLQKFIGKWIFFEAANDFQNSKPDVSFDKLLSMPDFAWNPPNALVYFYSASHSGHPGASMAVAWRKQVAAFDGTLGQQQQACTAASSYYLPHAKKIAEAYSWGIPQAVELIRLYPSAMSISSIGTVSRDDGNSVGRLRADAEQYMMLMQEAQEGNAGAHTIMGKKYLFGIDGFPRDHVRARKHLLAASKSNKGEAKALLGYIYALGLGVEVDLNAAAEWFYRGARENQSQSAYNGLGYIYMMGTDLYPRDAALSFHMFNKSAHMESPDGQLNLAYLYMTGTGVSQSFIKAMNWYSNAVNNGSSGAAYALAIMHLNGLGTVRDCPLALALLKLVNDRSMYVAKTLQDAYMAYEHGEYDEAAFHFLMLAESGHEVSQSNIAFMLDTGLTDIFFDGTLERKRFHAQRFYEMAAAQENLSSMLRLGDYSYYGYGLRRRSSVVNIPKSYVDDDGNFYDGWLKQSRLSYEYGTSNAAQAATYYRKILRSTWHSSAQIARANYNLGLMHLFGTGVERDFYLSKNYFTKSIETEERAPTAPVYAALILLYVLDIYEHVNFVEILYSFLQDPRFILLSLNIFVFLSMLIFRVILQRMRRRRAAALVQSRRVSGTNATTIGRSSELHDNNRRGIAPNS